jgi:cobalt-zinc-cadmium efflux system outer membrane protein
MAAALALTAGSAWAQGAAPAKGAADESASTLERAFEAAWNRQPEAHSASARRDAAAARLESAQSWLAEPAALEIAHKSDQLNRDLGSREYVAEIALPLWLPGERGRTEDLAGAESRLVESRLAAARLRVAAAVRNAWWGFQRALGEQALARTRLDTARALAADVQRRVEAGDLARADQHQAEGVVAAAQSAQAEADAALAAMAYGLRALTGRAPERALDAAAEPMPAGDPDAVSPSHPIVAELRNRAEAANRAAELAEVQSRSNPALTLAATRERGAAGERWDQSLTLGVRIPIGSQTRHRARTDQARAEVIEAQGQARIEHERLLAELGAARTRVDSARAQLAAAQNRAQLARDSRGFFEKSFRLGETDLPTRLRVEAEAGEAERQAARARIDLNAAISALRQALGLLPERGTER